MLCSWKHDLIYQISVSHVCTNLSCMSSAYYTQHMQDKVSVTQDNKQVMVTKADGLGVEKSYLHQGDHSCMGLLDLITKSCQKKNLYFYQNIYILISKLWQRGSFCFCFPGKSDHINFKRHIIFS